MMSIYDIHWSKALQALHYFSPVMPTLQASLQSLMQPSRTRFELTTTILDRRGIHRTTMERLVGPHGTTWAQPIWVSPFTIVPKPSWHLQILWSTSSRKCHESPVKAYISPNSGQDETNTKINSNVDSRWIILLV